MNRRFLFLAIVLCAAITLFAQAKKDVLCVYNFTYSSNVGSNYAEMLRNTVIDGINKTGRLKIVDTKNDEIMKAEISRRMSENALNEENALIESIKTLGARYIMTGHLASLATTSKSNNGKTWYTAKATYQIKIFNVADGAVICNDTRESTTSFLSTHTTADDARSEAIKYASLNLDDFVNKYFPVIGSVIEIAEAKKDEAKKVYIDLGSDLGITKGQKFDVREEREIAGRKINKVIGELKVESVEAGDISLCKVTKNGKAIQAAFNEGKKLSIITKVDNSIF